MEVLPQLVDCCILLLNVLLLLLLLFVVVFSAAIDAVAIIAVLVTMAPNNL